MFTRELNTADIQDMVLVVIGNLETPIEVTGIFKEESVIQEYYSSTLHTVSGGKLNVTPNQELYLFAISNQ